MNDKDLGLKTVEYFWKWSRSFYGSSFNYSLEKFVSLLALNKTKVDIILDGIGLGVREAELSDSRIESAMRRLALSSKGKIPSDYQVFFKFLSDESVKINWVDATFFVVKESTKDVINATAEIGKSLITTGKILNFLLPAIALFFVYVFLDNKSGGRLAGAVKGFKK